MLSTTTSISLRQRLLSGGKSYGPMLMSDSPVVAEILSLIGYDFIIIDHEHCPTSIHSNQELLRAIDSGNTIYGKNDAKTTKWTESIIRLPGPNDPVYMKKVLDSIRLPAGVLVPMVDNQQMAENIVQSIRYPQKGIRGCAIPFIRSNYYGIIDNTVDEYMNQCQNDLLVLVQIETLAGLKNIQSIANVNGIDGIFLGPFDISASLDKLGQWDDPCVQETIQKAEEEIHHNTKCLLAGFQPPYRTTYEMFHKHHYNLVCGSIDIGLLRNAAMNDYQNGYNAIHNHHEEEETKGS